MYVPVVWDRLAEQESIFTSSMSLSWKILSFTVNLQKSEMLLLISSRNQEDMVPIPDIVWLHIKIQAVSSQMSPQMKCQDDL